MTYETTAAAAERDRVLAAYGRRTAADGLYTPWNAGEELMRGERRRLAARVLRVQGVFPRGDSPCLEIGFGALGWFPELIGWGVRETSLHGIEIDPVRLDMAHRSLPAADLRLGSAWDLPWSTGTFELVISSTVFTSILDAKIKRAVAEEIVRVLKPGGALLWYDFAVPNRRNPDVRAIGRRELLGLFPGLSASLHKVTLAPPLARAVAPHSWLTATLLGSIPFLRTHLLGVFVKPAELPG